MPGTIRRGASTTDVDHSGLPVRESSGSCHWSAFDLWVASVRTDTTIVDTGVQSEIDEVASKSFVRQKLVFALSGHECIMAEVETAPAIGASAKRL
jgi:hypothetical protein